ncbi:MAG: PAS domain-containing protein [Bacteroidales bacterium]|nr:PAS domain-containing protein [Bacteroidales bacterium]
MENVRSLEDKRVLNTIINNVPAMVFYKDLQGKYIAANEMFCKQLHTTQEDIIGRTDFDFYEESRAIKYRDTDQELLKSDGVMDEFEEEIKINDEVRNFATRKVLLKDNDGNPYGVIGLAYDITNERKNEQDLFESRTKYKYMYDMFRLMVDNIPDPLWAKDLRKRYLFANKATCEKLLNAVDTEEPIGKTDLYFAKRERERHPGDPEWHTFGETCINSDDLTLHQKAAGKFDEFGHVMGQFVYLDVQKAPIFDSEGNIIGTVGSARDITRQKLMEQEFQILNQRNHAIIEALPDLMFLFDEQGFYLECYASSTNELVAPPEELIGKKVDEFFPVEIAELTLLSIKNCLEKKAVQTFEYKIDRTSSQHYYEARFTPVNENQVLCISRNITDRKILQSELIHAKEIAEESSRLKSTLLNNMSHELRTPLNGILGFSEIMSNELLDQEYVEMATHINNSGKRLMKTLDSIMQLSQLESGTKAIHNEKISIACYLKPILDGFSIQARNKGLYFEIRSLPDIEGHIDTFFFSQSISNIIENAVKFTNSGGISFDAGTIKQEGRRFLSIQIEDTGIGISVDHQKMIFEEFRQASEGQNRSFEGTGLGLTIAKKMINLLGGIIMVDSSIGKGSVFKVLLPFPENNDEGILKARTDEGEQVSFVPHNETNSVRHKILLVEDNEVNAQLTLAYIKGQHHLDWAADAAEALEKVRIQKYSLILMDINLGPGMDGLQATQQIRKISGYENVPIVALTGYTMFGDRDQLIQGGCTEYLAKPFSKNAILDLIEKMLHQVTAPLKPE